MFIAFRTSILDQLHQKFTMTNISALIQMGSKIQEDIYLTMTSYSKYSQTTAALCAMQQLRPRP